MMETMLGFCKKCGKEKITENDVPICVVCGDRRPVAGGVMDLQTGQISPLVVGEEVVKGSAPANYQERVLVAKDPVSSIDEAFDQILGIIERLPMPKNAKQFTQIQKFKQSILKIKQAGEGA
jgi:hypothetical protein